jgi:ATP-dependent phosphoenolpyruvate carboxykinase
VAYQVNGSRVEWNPSAARLRELAEEMPNASVTEFGNVAVKARVDSRSTRSTYLVEDSTNSRGQTITRAEYDRVAAIQDAYIAKSHMVVVDGYIGSGPQFRTRARLIMEAANANVAGMQKQLYYPAGAGYHPATWEPDTRVIYTRTSRLPAIPTTGSSPWTSPATSPACSPGLAPHGTSGVYRSVSLVGYVSGRSSQ